MCDVGFSRSAIAVREVWTNGFARNAPLVSAWRQERIAIFTCQLFLSHGLLNFLLKANLVFSGVTARSFVE